MEGKSSFFNELTVPTERQTCTKFRLNEVACLKASHDNYLKYFKERVEQKVEKYFELDDEGNCWKQNQNIEKKFLTKQKNKLENLKHSGNSFAHRLPIHTLKSDRSFLEGIPKTKFYHLVALEGEMKSEGVLRHRHEIDSFWEAANKKWRKQTFTNPPLSSEELKQLFTYKNTDHKQQGQSNNTTTTTTSSSSQINTFSPRDQSRGLHRNLSPIKEEKPKMSRPESRRIRFPEQPTFPKLHTYKVTNPKKFRSFVPKSLKSAPTYEQPRRKMEEKRIPLPSHYQKGNNYHERSVNHRLRCNAYQVAVVNTAMTERLMQKKYMGVCNYSVNDLLATDDRAKTPSFYDDVSSIHENCFTTETTIDKLPTKCKALNSSSTDFRLLPLTAGPSRHEVKREAKEEEKDVRQHEENEDHGEHQLYCQQPPLCINDMFLRKESLHVKEVVPSIKMWTNYAS